MIFSLHLLLSILIVFDVFSFAMIMSHWLSLTGPMHYSPPRRQDSLGRRIIVGRDEYSVMSCMQHCFVDMNEKHQSRILAGINLRTMTSLTE